MARHESWNTYADGYDRAAREDEREFKRLDLRIATLETTLRDIAKLATQKVESADDPLLAIERLARNALSR